MEQHSAETNCFHLVNNNKGTKNIVALFISLKLQRDKPHSLLGKAAYYRVMLQNTNKNTCKENNLHI